MTTAREIAQWMVDQLEIRSELYQEDAVHEIAHMFGEEFTYENENGNAAIDKTVLKEFKKLTGDSVIWEHGQRMWRKRHDYDEPGRMQY